MRTNINFRLVCAKCGNEMEADLEKSKMHASGCEEATAKVAIEPCMTCYRKAKEPERLINKALELIKEQKS